VGNKIEIGYLEWKLAADKWDLYAPYHTRETFLAYIGDPDPQYSVNIDMMLVDKDAGRKINQLNGPHSVTIIKAWFAKHGNLKPL